MRKILISFITLNLLFSCQSQDKGLLEISPEIFTDNKIFLSEIADDIFYVPLDNSIPIGIAYKLLFTSNHIYLSVKDVGILKFNRSGKFICKIGSRGKGPGEYIYYMAFSVDENTGNVYIMDMNSIKTYSSSGRFIRSINYRTYLSYTGSDIDMFNGLIFVPDFIEYGNSKYNWLFLDTLGNVVSKKKNSVPIYKTDLVLPGQIYQFDNKLFYFNFLNDTIFSISPDLKGRVAYLFGQGDYRYPKEYFAFDFTKLSNYFRPTEMFETKHFIFLSYSYRGMAAMSVIDKRTKKVFLGYKKIENTSMSVKTRPEIENDLDGGLPFTTRSVINYYEENGNEYIISLINPFDLKKHLTTDDFKTIIPKYSEKKNALVKFASATKETDNPILMIIRVKN